MKTYFLDTSAFVKRYHHEAGTEVIDKIFRQVDKELFISLLKVSKGIQLALDFFNDKKAG